MITREELILLLESPSERLSVEHKYWLDLKDKACQAKLAKAAIALANHGGGIIVFGMKEDDSVTASFTSHECPTTIKRYEQTNLNALVGRFADPQFHCELHFIRHPVTGYEHAFIKIPGGMIVPVMSKRGCDGVINAQRCYVRKPGPKSEEPYTAEEWRTVFELCLQARRESMLEAIRIIVQGHGAAPAPDTSQVAGFPTHAPRVSLSVGTATGLLRYGSEARRRWSELIEKTPDDDPSRMPFGHYELEFEIDNVSPAASLTALRDMMDEARKVRHTGWGPFVELGRSPLSPRPVGDSIEVWLGNPEDTSPYRNSAHSDFWRANRYGLLFLLRGYDEDAVERIRPGTIFDVTMPIWRVGEAMLYMSRLAKLWDGDETSVTIRACYTGLQNRRIGSVTGRRHFAMTYICADDDAQLQTRATAAQLEDNLPEVLHPFLTPLYEKFEFFGLGFEIVTEELERMRAGRF